MTEQELTDLCVDAIISTRGSDGDSYRCDACADDKPLRWNDVRSHAENCALLRQGELEAYHQRVAPGVRVAYDFATKLIVLIRPESTGEAGLYWDEERLITMPHSVTDAVALVVARAILNAHSEGFRRGRLALGADVLMMLQTGGMIQ